MQKRIECKKKGRQPAKRKGYTPKKDPGKVKPPKGGSGETKVKK